MKIYLYLFLYVLAFSSNAQQWDWAKNFSYGAQNNGGSIGTDNAQNIYVIGYSLNYTGGGSGGSYSYNILWKFNSFGQILWADTLEVGAGGSSVCDTNGNVYVTGGNKIYKYNTAGNQLWTVTGISNSGYTNIALHPSGGFAVVGSTISDTSKSIYSRYDQNGNLLWTKTGEFSSGGTNLKCDNLGNTYITGGGPKDPVSGNNGFLVKYNSSGTLLYNKIIAATINSMAIDNNNNIYIGGWFSAIPINILGTVYSSNYPSNPVPQFLIKYAPTGNILWYKVITGDLGKGGIATDKNGNIYLTSAYTTLTIDNLNLSAPYNNATNLFIMKADSTGNILWYKNSTANTSGAGATGVAICLSGADIYTTGFMTGTNSFDSFTLTQLSTYSDLLLTKVSQTNSASVPSSIIKEKMSELNVFPNPASHSIAINFSSSVKGNLILNITNELGQTVYAESKKDFSGEYANTIDLSKQPAGIYFVKILADTRSATRKIVLK